MADHDDHDRDPPQPRDKKRRDRRSQPASADVRISKALSYTLRHGAAKEGLALDAHGYASVSDVLNMSKFRALQLDLPTLRALVASNDKQRFTLKSTLPSDGSDGPADASAATAAVGAEHLLIRANQGHSIQLSSEALQLTPLVPGAPDFPPRVVHGTFYWAYEAILASGGLRRMGRTHIHFASETDYRAGEVISGMRADAEVLFVVDTNRAVERGIRFWRSANGVVLTEGDEGGGVPMQCVLLVRDLRGLGTLWEDGSVVKELPERLRGRKPPRGKEHVLRRENGRGGQMKEAKKEAKKNDKKEAKKNEKKERRLKRKDEQPKDEQAKDEKPQDAAVADTITEALVATQI